ncbi:hypothetical protein SAMN02745126_03562 [Enhydrobacter aerosaccus]|uniref:Uncharacterized protein n=2 Tax=Enhydrobacter aerosaccus TaxID=225324 RepID=A0A1T4R3N6_9HYPH|nr:hypothetical protein SAMN02745126_03562 [Enhydrobacter aerosaccus]
MPPKQKPRSKKAPAAPRKPRARKQTRAAAPPPPPSLEQGLREMAYDGALSFFWVGVALTIVVALAIGAFALWSLRPVPGFASDGVETGSPFDVTFRVENMSAWFPLANLKVSCVLTYAGVPEIPSIPAADLRLPGGNGTALAPGQSAAFRCPFRSRLKASSNDELGVALRSEVYFHSEYDLPLLGSYRITADNGPFILNTRLIPPRWTGRPGK